MRPRCIGGGIALLALSLAAGCGGGDVPAGRLGISGNITYKGEPVREGTIQFVPHPGVKTFSGASITNGRYRIPADRGLDPGDYTIKISSIEAPPAAEPGGLPGPDPKERLPEKYNTKSTLTKEVKAGETTYDFNLD
jgi:hypothetical protein